ncbi:MAG: SMC-Scp complex subunit ScpB [Verrucomicrobiota bacterium]
MMTTLKPVVEAILLASESALSAEELVRIMAAAAKDLREQEKPVSEAIAEADEEAVSQAIQALNADYTEGGRAFQIVQRKAGWRLLTRPEFAEYLHALFPERKPSRLSGPALETLAIIAYRQPITKSEIEAVRGVSVDAMVQKILDLGLVRVGGRSEQPGRPLLYETTEIFLEHFGVENVAELPNAQELRRVALPQPETEEEAEPAAEAVSPEQAEPEVVGEKRDG